MTILFFLVFFGILVLIFLFKFYNNFFTSLSPLTLPRHRIAIDRDIMVAMPDGIKLATDIYRPKLPGKYPAIVLRTPYNKSGTATEPYKQVAMLFASQGYVFVVQDVRGKYGSEGEFLPYHNEALDGHTTVNWVGESLWCNGKVALAGLSYPGSCTWLAARYKSPYLCTIISMFTAQNTYSIFIDHGMPFLKGPLFWLAKYSHKTENDLVSHKSLESILWKLPVSELDMHSVNQKIPFYRKYLSHIVPDPFWDEISTHGSADNLDIPAFIVGGWYDPFLKGTIEDYERMIQAPEDSKNHHSCLVLGPWAHNPSQKFHKDFDCGKNARFSLMFMPILKWCNYWLKEDKTARPVMSKVRYFVMGKNEWRESNEWPPHDVVFENFYLSSESKDKEFPHGSLSSLSAPQELQKQTYLYNPHNPVLFRGEYLLKSEGWIVPVEQTEIAARDDVLVFITQPLTKEVTIAGSAKLILYVSSEAQDTDFCAKICDMYPNGKTYNLTTGIMRMRFRESLHNPKMMKPGEIYCVEISLRSVAHAFLEGHRIQLQITSSDFPVHARNLNMGLNNESSDASREALQTIYSGGMYPSSLLLPILP